MKSQKHIPPKLAQRLLTWLIRHELAEEVLGDLEEKFYTMAQKSLFRAKLNYWYQVLHYLRPFAIRKSSRSKHANNMAMFQHNLILTFRSFKKHKSQFLINLTGLTTGLACVLFIYLWVDDERKIDKFHENDDRLYQVMSNHTDANGTHTWKGVPGLLLEEIQARVPEVAHVSAATDAHQFTLFADGSSFKAQGKFASPGILDVFTLPLIAGNKEDVLADKSAIVLTESLAKRLFKTIDVVGKQVSWHFMGNEKTLQVSGVLKDLPKNASDRFDYLMSWDYYHDDLINYKNWNNYYGRIAVVLGENSDKASAQTKIDAILKEKQEDERVDLFLAKYSDRYLFSKYENGMQAGGRIEYVHLFSIIALFILFIACINFINLSTAKASHKTKELGIKKTLGASRQSLMGQFFTESVLLSFTALVVAFLIVWAFLPQFNFITQKELTLGFNNQMILIALSLVLVVGGIAGAYPALYLSGFKSLEVLKGKRSASAGEIWIRKGLVVVQFTLSIILIASVLVVYQQMEFVKNKNLGYDRNNLIYFDREGKLIENYKAFIHELKNTSGVEDVAVSGFMVGGGNSTGGVSWPGKTEEDQIQFWEIHAGYGLIGMMGIELLKGRTFSDEFGADSVGIIFNEAAIAAMGIENPIGKTVSHYKGERRIIGVVKNFNTGSLHTKVEPTLFLFEPENTHLIMAKLKQGNETETIGKLEELYSSFNPGYVFNPRFIDQDYQALYTSEERVSILSRYFAGLAIFISCLGLFGLAAFTTERRIKEIGIRKVLGSSIFGIINLLTMDYTKMVGVAIVIALPVSYFVAKEWLTDFAYRIDLEWWLFACSAIAALIIAWLTVGFQTFKAARANPVECLRDE